MQLYFAISLYSITCILALDTMVVYHRVFLSRIVCQNRELELIVVYECMSIRSLLSWVYMCMREHIHYFRHRIHIMSASACSYCVCDYAPYVCLP